MLIESIQLDSLLTPRLQQLDDFFSQATFVISHKHETVNMLRGVLAFLPAQSTVVIVSNCTIQSYPQLKQEIAIQSAGRNILLVHQKDPIVAAILRNRGVFGILGHDGLVANGKGEGMYIGTLCATLLEQQPRWIIYYDADNWSPAALLEYSLAMARLFQEAAGAQAMYPEDSLHNIRICWSSKPDLSNGWVEAEDANQNHPGRCTREVSPLVHQLFKHWFPDFTSPIITSNAGEEALSIAAAQSLQFSSGYSVETFLLLGLLIQALDEGMPVLFQQYLAKSPHIHTKGDDEHILKMIAESLGCFAAFSRVVPPGVMGQVELVCTRLGITSLIKPRAYPSLNSLGLHEQPSFLCQHYRLSPSQGEQRDSLEDATVFAR